MKKTQNYHKFYLILLSMCIHGVIPKEKTHSNPKNLIRLHWTQTWIIAKQMLISICHRHFIRPHIKTNNTYTDAKMINKHTNLQTRKMKLMLEKARSPKFRNGLRDSPSPLTKSIGRLLFLLPLKFSCFFLKFYWLPFLSFFFFFFLCCKRFLF